MILISLSTLYTLRLNIYSASSYIQTGLTNTLECRPTVDQPCTYLGHEILCNPHQVVSGFRNSETHFPGVSFVSATCIRRCPKVWELEQMNVKVRS